MSLRHFPTIASAIQLESGDYTSHAVGAVLAVPVEGAEASAILILVLVLSDDQAVLELAGADLEPCMTTMVL